MIKISALCGAVILSVCALSACGDVALEYEVTEEEWRAAFSEEMFENVTIKMEGVNGNQSVVGEGRLDRDKYYDFATFSSNGLQEDIQEIYTEHTGGIYRCFTREYSVSQSPPKWKYLETEEQEAPGWIKNIFSAGKAIAVYADRYSEFTFDGEKTYVAKEFKMPSISFSDGEVVLTQETSAVSVSLRFENKKAVWLEVNDSMIYHFSEYGTTVVTMPEIDA